MNDQKNANASERPFDGLVMPRWSSAGTPVNAEAAMSDALAWLETITPKDAQNRERLGACIAELRRFGAA